MEKKHIYDLINVPLEGLCLSVMFLFTAGVSGMVECRFNDWCCGAEFMLCFFKKRTEDIFEKLSISIARNRRFLFYIAWQYSGNRLFLRLADLFRYQNPVYQHGLDFQRTV